MIYTVELNFSDASNIDEWNAWYETYLKQLILLDGLETAQRFRAVAGSEPTWEYLALYTIPNLDVYESEAYRKIGGGGNASKASHDAISRRRNVYNGAERMAAVSDEARVLFWEGAPDDFGLPDCLPVALTAGAGNQQAGATKINGTPERRAIAVVDAATVERYDFTTAERLAVYAPITQRYGSRRYAGPCQTGPSGLIRMPGRSHRQGRSAVSLRMRRSETSNVRESALG